jgi:hypothetical protein
MNTAVGMTETDRVLAWARISPGVFARWRQADRLIFVRRAARR